MPRKPKKRLIDTIKIKAQTKKLSTMKGVQLIPIDEPLGKQNDSDRLREYKGRWRVKLGASVTNAKPIDRRFETENQAISFVKDQLQFRANRTSDLGALSDSEIADARKALDLLKNFGTELTLTNITELWISKQPKNDPWTVQQTCDAYYKTRQDTGCSAEWLRQLDMFFKDLCENYGDEDIHEIAEDEVVEYMEVRYGDWENKTYNNNLTKMKALFTFAASKKKVMENVSKFILRKNETTKTPEVLSPQNLHILLETAKESAPEVVVPFALQAFAGLRSSEVSRIRWGAIGGTAISLSPSITKTKRRRVIPITPPLQKILDWAESSAKPNDLKVLPFNLKKWNRLRLKIIGVCNVDMPKNSLRHSFVSYRLEDTKNENQVALEAGHTIDILHSNYRSLVEEDDVLKYWNLYSENTIPMSKNTVAS